MHIEGYYIILTRFKFNSHRRYLIPKMHFQSDHVLVKFKIGKRAKSICSLSANFRSLGNILFFTLLIDGLDIHN